METRYQCQILMRQRPFAYSELYCHPPLPWPAFTDQGMIRPEINPADAAVTACS